MKLPLVPSSPMVSSEMASSQSVSATPPLHFIDGLRGLAMLMVLFYHCAINSDGWVVPGHLLGFVNYGYVGVNLFLVLSGFCLYWPFVHTPGRREPTLRQFAWKRCRRILPPYYAAMTFFWLLLLLDVLTHHHFHEDATTIHHVLLSLVWHFLMLHNLRPEYVLSINGVFWSLSLEFSLYILFPVLVEAFRRLGPWVPSLLVLVIDVSWHYAVATQVGLLTNPSEIIVLYNSLPGRCFEFVAGMTAAWVLARRYRTQNSILQNSSSQMSGLLYTAAFLLCGVAAVWVTLRPGNSYAFADIIWGLCFACLLIAAGQSENLFHRALSSPVLVRLGTFSYSVYLIHLPLTKALDSLIMRHHLPPMPLGIGVIVPLMLGLGYLFHLKFERPFMGTPRSTPGATPAPVSSLPMPFPIGLTQVESKLL